LRIISGIRIDLQGSSASQKEGQMKRTEFLAGVLGVMILFELPVVIPVIGQGSVRTSAVGAGELAPDFSLADQNGNRVTLSDARGQSPVVLVFYRGYW
jgi:hypothetical protein